MQEIASLSDEEVTRRARSDPDAPPLTERQLAAMRRVPKVKHLRLRLGLSQEDFARTYHLSVATLRDWEQGRCEPDQPSRTLLQLIEIIPEEVKAALEKYVAKSASA